MELVEPVPAELEDCILNLNQSCHIIGLPAIKPREAHEQQHGRHRGPAHRRRSVGGNGPVIHIDGHRLADDRLVFGKVAEGQDSLVLLYRSCDLGAEFSPVERLNAVGSQGPQRVRKIWDQNRIACG